MSEPCGKCSFQFLNFQGDSSYVPFCWTNSQKYSYINKESKKTRTATNDSFSLIDCLVSKTNKTKNVNVKFLESK